MKIQKVVRLASVSLALSGFLAFAPSALAEGRIQKRKERQQHRIAEGIESGQLTAGETARLEKKETRLNREVRDMREDNGGRLTAKNRRIINRQQNRLSRDIYREKHDGEKQSN
jgi:hypothetical protein